MKVFAIDPVGLGILSLRQLYQRLPTWIQINALGLLFSLPLITWPAAQAGLHYAVREALLERLDGGLSPRAAFLIGFKRHFVRSTALFVVDVALGGVIVFSFVFWTTREIAFLNYAAAVSVYALLFWLVCQPYLFPLLVENPDLPVPEVFRRAVLTVLRTPLYATLTAGLILIFLLIGSILLGPVLLVLGTLIALVAVQSIWVMEGQALPTVLEADQRDRHLHEP